MKAEKPARFVERLTAELAELKARAQRDGAEIARLKLAADAADDVATRAREMQRVAEQARDSQAELLRAALDGELIRRQADTAQHTAMISSLGFEGADALRADPVGFLQAQVCGHAAEIAVLHTDHAKAISELMAKIHELKQRDQLLDDKEAELRVLVAKVETRMHARERQEAAAILNRRALAGVVPERNRK